MQEFVLCKSKRLGIKNKSVTLFWYIWIVSLKNYYQMWISTSNLSDFKVSCKNKIFEFGNKNTLLAYFQSEIWLKLISYLKSSPSNFSKFKNSCKSKLLKFVTMKILSRYFWNTFFQNKIPLNLGSELSYVNIFELQH